MKQIWIVVSVALSLSSCGSEAPKVEMKPAPAAAKPLDELQRLPKPNLVESHVVDKELLGKPFMPGGTLGHYKKGAHEYDIFVGQLARPNDAAFLLIEWKKALTQAHYLASYGGHFGMDAGRPVFVFTKGRWIAGIAGLAEKDGDAEARVLAAALN